VAIAEKTYAVLSSEQAVEFYKSTAKNAWAFMVLVFWGAIALSLMAWDTGSRCRVQWQQWQVDDVSPAAVVEVVAATTALKAVTVKDQAIESATMMTYKTAGQVAKWLKQSSIRVYRSGVTKACDLSTELRQRAEQVYQQSYLQVQSRTNKRIQLLRQQTLTYC
jgi:hypothetical protein